MQAREHRIKTPGTTGLPSSRTGRWVYLLFVSAVLMSGFSVLPLYFIAGFMADDQPRELALEDKDEQRFWQGVRASPTRTARDIRGRLRDIDRRLADIESFVTTENRSLAREIEQLR